MRQLLPAAESGDLLLAEIRDGLSELATATCNALSDPECRFRPLLPDEARPLLERATALYDWVRGFLFGFGVQSPPETGLSEQTREILRDFTDLTRLDLTDLDLREESEANEEALADVTEFVRVATLLIHAEQAPADRVSRQP